MLALKPKSSNHSSTKGPIPFNFFNRNNPLLLIISKTVCGKCSYLGLQLLQRLLGVQVDPEDPVVPVLRAPHQSRVVRWVLLGPRVKTRVTFKKSVKS